MKKLQLTITTVSILFLLSILFVPAGYATEEYAEKTGSECQVCHIDPLGGGELTESGKGYLLAISPEAAQHAASENATSRIIKLVFGYVHIVTAFFWFGTILYVHLILKPAYASQGLPRSEVKVGLISMAIMTLTGMVLTYYKVPSFSFLVASKFGILLLAKISLFTIMVISALFVVLVIGPGLKKKKIAQPSQSGELTLAEYVSGSRLWKNGSHMKRHQAGVDLTDILSQAPHGEDKIMAMPEVGNLSMKKAISLHDAHKRIFYFMAYMNLCFVFIILFILALWRWY